MKYNYEEIDKLPEVLSLEDFRIDMLFVTQQKVVCYKIILQISFKNI